LKADACALPAWNGNCCMLSHPRDAFVDSVAGSGQSVVGTIAAAIPSAA